MYYKQKYIESIETLKSNINGLSSDEAKKRLEEHGYNELKEGVKVPTWKLFLESFNRSVSYNTFNSGSCSTNIFR